MPINELHAEAILYGQMGSRHSINLERLRWAGISFDQIDLNQLYLDAKNGYVEDAFGFSGSCTWIIKATALPPILTELTQPDQYVRDVISEFLEHLFSLPSLRQHSLPLLSDVQSKRTNTERIIKCEHEGFETSIAVSADQMSVVEQSAAGEWRVYIHPRGDYHELLYIDQNDQLLGTVEFDRTEL